MARSLTARVVSSGQTGSTLAISAGIDSVSRRFALTEGTVAPFSPALEDLVFPHVPEIVAGVKEVVR